RQASGIYSLKIFLIKLPPGTTKTRKLHLPAASQSFEISHSPQRLHSYPKTGSHLALQLGCRKHCGRSKILLPFVCRKSSNITAFRTSMSISSTSVSLIWKTLQSHFAGE